MSGCATIRLRLTSSYAQGFGATLGESVFDSHANAHRDAGEIIVEIEAPDAAVAT